MHRDDTSTYDLLDCSAVPSNVLPSVSWRYENREHKLIIYNFYVVFFFLIVYYFEYQVL